MERKLSLQQLVHIVSEGFRQLFEEFEFWVEAEIADIKPHKSRLYCELIEADQQGTILAKAKGIIRDPSIIQKFLKQTGMGRSELIGSAVLMRGSCSFHPTYGRSISIKEFNAEYVLGKQLTHRQATIARLQKDGFWKNNTTRSLPSKPLHCVVITGQNSSGYEDFQSIMDQSGYHITITVLRCAIHGNQASSEVANSLEDVTTQIHLGMNYDAVAIVRGGGGKEGFLWQDDYTIAKLIDQIPIPVILAIGHTRDQTLLDQTVFHSAKTPSDAAWFLIDHYRTIIEKLESIDHEINQEIVNYFKLFGDKLGIVYEKINHLFDIQLQNKIDSVHSLYQSIKLLDPLTHLEYGSSILTNSESIIQHGPLSVGEQYTLYTKHGTYGITVNSVE